MKTKHIAHITIEALTPLKMGSGSSDYLQDSPILKDWNSLPMILGTSIAGVLRKEFDGKKNDLFGDEDSKKKDAKGSKIIISNALLCINNKNKVSEKLLFENEKSAFVKIFSNLPIREHTAITDKGVANDKSKFNEEVVYKGSRFKFSIEFVEDDIRIFESILDLLKSSSFRLGGGSSKGFGKFKIFSIKKLDLSKCNYEDYSSSLNCKPEIAKYFIDYNVNEIKSEKYCTYKLCIKPDDFFMFGSGFGDKDADMTPVYEQVVDYENAKLSENQILIPASSIKGALSHRTAFYYNKNNDIFIDNLNHDEYNKFTGENNKAVKVIFGHKKELAEDKKTELGQKGKILISDCFKTDKEKTKVFDHVSIDRFTGGAIDEALFQEKTVADDDKCYEIEILMEKSIDCDFITAFESALIDICKGMLPLGGSTTKGHGIFRGTLYQNKTIKYESVCNER